MSYEQILDTETTKTEEEESKRLGGDPPLKTLGKLALGPVLSEIGSSTYGVVDGVWVGKMLGKEGLSAAGSVFVLQYIVHGFSSFIQVSLNSKLGYLYGKKSSARIPCVLVDIFRISILLGLIVPALLLPLAHPVMNLIGISEKNQTNGFLYLLPVCSGFLITALFHFSCAILQANGLSLHYGIAMLTTNVIDMCIFDPLFLVAFKTKIWGSSLATIISNLIVFIIVIVYLTKKKLFIIPEDYKWFGSFSHDTLSASKVGLSAFITQIAMTLPAVLIQKYLSLSSHEIGVSTEVMGVWHIMARVYHVVEMIMTAMARAFIPAASFAYGSSKGKRFLLLAVHILWIGVSWAAICSFSFSVFPVQICRIWTDDSTFMTWLEKMIPPSVYTAALSPMRATVSAILQSMKRGHSASLLNFLAQFVAIPTFASILYFTKKDDPVRIVWCYVFSDSTAFLLSLLFAISPIKEIMSLFKNENNNTNNTSQPLNEEGK
ncbi:MatE family protein [Tritrichomonas foetus]|uniref:MatE family protein n=1 Tax=Tritrichomonas foetus TaxID=1144522 RepID=A0A1J4KNL4_9EUKA|nr:MatE family protein [Tritrichomonas foetus]|eukprot:OHT12863.1 MatE family protein [Tritrichomonas foetus]